MNLDDEMNDVMGETEVIDGVELLGRVRDWLGRFICTVVESDLDLLTLWGVHTHLVVETYTTPRLVIDSPVPESGKTTCLEHLQRLCLRPVQIATLASPALLTRMLDVELRTLLIDEADRSLSPDKEGIGDLLAVINSGYKRGAKRPVLVPGKGGKWEVAEMPTFAPVAIAGNGPRLPDDTRSRTIRVLLLPDLDGSVEESDWELIEEDAVTLARDVAKWADQIRDQIRADRPRLPAGITSRFREKWSPLKRVAAAAGGDWPERVDAMALHDKEQYEMDKEDGLVRETPAVLLLRHIYEVWPGRTPFVPTLELIDLLVMAHPSVWGDEGPFGKRLTAHRLGRMLATGYKINSDREERTAPRGYRYSTFTRAWSRLRVASPQSTGASGATGETGAPEEESAPDAPETPDAPATSRGPAEPASQSDSLFAGEPSESEPRRHFNDLWPADRCGCGAQFYTPESRERGWCQRCEDNRNRQAEGGAA